MDSLTDFGVTADALQSILMLLGTAATGAGAIWLFFREKINKWRASRKAHNENFRSMVAKFPKLCANVEHSANELRLVNMRLNARSDYSDAAECEFDVHHKMTKCNRTLAEVIGVGKRDLEGFGYVGYIHPEDVQAFRDGWKQCDKEHRPFVGTFRWKPVGGGIITIDWRMHPIPDPPETPIQMWTGVGVFCD